MSKKEMVARLEALGEMLGRQIDTSGNVAELELRLREAEEELEATQGGVLGGGFRGGCWWIAAGRC